MEPIHLLGAGSIGLLVASYTRMAFPSYPIRMLLRRHHAQRLQQENLNNPKMYMEVCLMAPSVSKRPRMVRLPAQIIEDNDSGQYKSFSLSKIKNLVICTKAYDAANALQSVIQRLSSETKIIVLCNGGLAVRDELNDLLATSEEMSSPMPCLVLATTTHGAYREVPKHIEQSILLENDRCEDDLLYHVTHAGIGKTFVEEQPKLAALWDRAGLRCQSIPSDEMVIQLWHKLAANCVCNPMTAILGCENGMLLHNVELYQRLAKHVVQEVSAVAQRSCTVSLKHQVTMEPQYLMHFVEEVIKDNKHNKSSMWQDVMRKQKTEIDYLNWYVTRLGERLGIDTPANTELCERVHKITATYHTKTQ
jgi:2-dehydropantoate 2-reductase